MKYLITAQSGLKEKIEIYETPQIGSKIEFNNKFYKVKYVIYYQNYIEIHTNETNVIRKPIRIKWN